MHATAFVTVEPPRDPSHGDLATNAAMVLAKPAAPIRARWPRRSRSRHQAGALTRSVGGRDRRAGLHQPALTDDTWRASCDDPRRGRRLWPLDHGQAASTVNVEYVSANPTGPMHMGHCRGAVVGDALARCSNSPGTR
jgi:arginyl-tRNA synthetase